MAKKALPNVANKSNAATVHKNNGSNFPNCGGRINRDKPFVHVDRDVNCTRNGCLGTVQLFGGKRHTAPKKNAQPDVTPDLAAMSADLRTIVADTGKVRVTEHVYDVLVGYAGEEGKQFIISGIDAPDADAALDIVRAGLRVHISETTIITWQTRL